MREKFIELPEPIQREILKRLAISAVAFIALIALFVNSCGIYTLLPFGYISLYSALNGLLLFLKTSEGDYVVISGICFEIEYSLIRHRPKSILLKADDTTIRLKLRNRTGKIEIGTKLDLYLATDTPVYEKGAVRIPQKYIALELATASAANIST
jgi:hypothetical protein